MGRNAQPLQLIKSKGRSHHLTRAEIARRESSEIRLKNKTVKASPQVMADTRALVEFKRLKKLYKEIDFVGSLDEHLINQYCLAVSELDDLLTVMGYSRTDSKSADPVTRKLGLTEFMELDVEVRQKRQEIIKLSDRLYLNPVARTKNLPMKKKEKRDPNADLFD